MMEKSISDIALIEVAYMLHPITAIKSPEQVLGLFKRIGYEPPVSDLVNSLSEVSSSVEGLITRVVNLVVADTDDKKMNAIPPLLSSVKNALESLIRLETVLRSEPGLAGNFVANAKLDKLPERLLNFLLFQNLYKRYPKLFAAFYLMGILDEEELPKDENIFQPACKLKIVRWDRIPKYLSKPREVIEELYTWSTDFESDTFLTRLQRFLHSMQIAGGLYKQSDSVKNALGNVTPLMTELRLPVFSDGVFPAAYSQFGISLTPVEASGVKKKGLAAIPYFMGNAAFTFDLSEKWEALFQSSIAIDAGLGMLIRPPFQIELLQNILSSPQNAASLDASFAVQQKKSQNGKSEEIYLFGTSKSSHLFASDISIGFFGSKNASGQDAGAKVEIKRINLLLTTEGSDSFLSKILPNSGINADFDFGVVFSMANGIYFTGSAGVEILLPTHIQLGPIEITGITIGIKLDEDKIPLEISANLKAELGPLVVVVEKIGLTSLLTFPVDRKGNLGPLNASLGFKPPNGVGLSINAGAVIGGGYLFFDFEKQEYAGVLELTIAGFISAKAIGLITTKMPDGSQGFSMLIIITAEFMPPFQLGYGFTLIGVGGLLGLNRTMLVDPLRNAVRTGAVNSIMFPQNVIANAPRIISDLKAIFPPYEGKFLIGPMAKMGWGTPTLISLSLGLIIEIPGNIAILGVLKVALPEERIPIIQIQVLFVGIIDFDKKMLSFDASLYDSFILTMTLEGDMAVRLKWGDNPDFLITVGGFHPSFNPPPLSLPTMRRIAINILNTDIALVRVECYQAVTSNTVQFGAKAEIRLDLSVCKIEGYIGFDALLQFNPFYFIIEAAAGFKLSVVGMDLLSVRIRMSLEGPNPWRAKGTGSVSILFFEVSADFDITWGEEKNTSIPEISILPKFIEDIQKPANWNAVGSVGKNLLVSLRKLKETPDPLLIIHPAGALVIQQKMLPLLAKLDKIGSKRIADVQQISIVRASSAGVDLQLTNVPEDFAVAQYQDMSDAEKLSRPSFQKLNGGVSLSLDGSLIKIGKFVRRQVAYEVTIVDKEPAKPLLKGLRFTQTGALFAHFLNGNHVTQSVLSASYKKKLEPFADKMDLLRDGYTVAFQSNNKAFNSSASFASEMEANTYLNEQIRKNPSMKKQLHIIPDFELQSS